MIFNLVITFKIEFFKHKRIKYINYKETLDCVFLSAKILIMARVSENPLQTFLDKLYLEKSSIPVKTYTDFIDIHKEQIIKIFQNYEENKSIIYDILINIIIHINDTDYAEILLLKLFDIGIDPNIHITTNHSLLFYASLHYKHRLVKVLLENGENPNIPTRNIVLSNYNSPLEFLLNRCYSSYNYDKIKENRLKTIKHLLDCGTYITDIPMLKVLKDEYIRNTSQNTVNDNIQFYFKYRKNITIKDNTIILNILEIQQPLSLQTLCKFSVLNVLKLDPQSLVDNRIIPSCITF